MNMEEQIRKIVSENLPEQTAGVMQEFIDEAGANKLRLGEKTKALEVANKELDRLHKLEAEAKAAIERCKGKEKELDEAEVAIAERERDLAHVEEIQIIRLESKDNECAAHRFALSTVFRNNTIKRIMTSTGSHEEITPPTYDGGCYNHKSLNNSKDETVTETSE